MGRLWGWLDGVVCGREYIRFSEHFLDIFWSCKYSILSHYSLPKDPSTQNSQSGSGTSVEKGAGIIFIHFPSIFHSIFPTGL